MMAAAAAQFTPASEAPDAGIEPTWRCVWLVVEAGVVCADARLPGLCRASGRNRSTTCSKATLTEILSVQPTPKNADCDSPAPQKLRENPNMSRQAEKPMIPSYFGCSQSGISAYSRPFKHSFVPVRE
jgi:hypothetical protein